MEPEGILQEENDETAELSSSLTDFVDAKNRLTSLLIPYMVDGKIEYQKYPQLVKARNNFFEIYVRKKYNAGQTILAAAQLALGQASTSEHFQDALVDLVCRTPTSESESGSAKYLVQSVVRRAYNSFFLKVLRDAEEHHKQAQDLRQVRLLTFKSCTL